MLSLTLKLLAVLAGFASAGCWLYGVKTISREKELERRKRIAARKGETPNLGGVQILDGDVRYDLIATLRHQSQWNRAGAILAAVAIALQALDLLSATLTSSQPM